MSYTELVNDLLDLRDEQTSLEEVFQAAFPREWDRLQAIRDEIPRVQGQITSALREVGNSVTVEGYRFQVQQVKKTVVAVPDVLDRAKEMDELPMLLEYGFLYYEVNPDQLTRLPERVQNQYREFIKTEAGTPRVTLPKELK
jgi:hypothetical protein